MSFCLGRWQHTEWGIIPCSKSCWTHWSCCCHIGKIRCLGKNHNILFEVQGEWDNNFWSCWDSYMFTWSILSSWKGFCTIICPQFWTLMISMVTCSSTKFCWLKINLLSFQSLFTPQMHKCLKSCSSCTHLIYIVDMSLNYTNSLKVSFLPLFSLQNDYCNIAVQYNIT